MDEINQAENAITILEKLTNEHRHPWIKLALADAYYANNEMKKTLFLLEEMNNLYPGYLPVTLAYARALNAVDRPEKSIELLLRQLRRDEYPEIYRLLARAYHLNGQASAALEATGNQYVLQGYYELALRQYNNALKHKDLSQTSRARLQTKKDELLEVIKQRD
jgi:predicted Zn-dependent protease